MNDQEKLAAEIGEISARVKRQYRTTSSAVTSTIREAIFRAVFLPGDYLNQYELAEWLGVSRTPVRTALVQLESEGLVVFHPHRGCVVAELDVHKIQEIYDIRNELEALAMKRGIETMTDARLQRLDEIDQQMLVATGDQLVDLRTEFYNVLFDRYRNPILVDLIQRLRTDVGRYLKHLQLFDASHSETHDVLLGMVRARDVDGAQRYIVDHLNAIREQVMEELIRERF